MTRETWFFTVIFTLHLWLRTEPIWKEKNIISKIYSDENVYNYEITLLNNVEDGYENKKKISEIIILYNFIFEIAEITLKKLSNMEKEFKIGIDCVIELSQENIIKNNQKISLNLLESKDTESYFIIKKYMSTSRLVLNNKGALTIILLFINVDYINLPKRWIFNSVIKTTTLLQQMDYNVITVWECEIKEDFDHRMKLLIEEITQWWNTL